MVGIIGRGAASLPALSIGSIVRGGSLAVRCSGGCDGDGVVSATCRPYWPWRHVVAVAELALSAAPVRGHAVAGQPTVVSDLPQWLRTDLDLRRGIRLRRGFGFCGFGGDPLGFSAAVIQLWQIRSAWIVADLDLRRGIPLILLRRVRSASGRRRFGPRGL